jgi:hypothetical protein
MAKTRVLYFLIIVSCSICPHRLLSQVISNNEGAKEKHFVYEVKEIDEFFERFNDERNSFIRGVYNAHHIKFNIPRQRLVRSLFNYENMWKDSVLMNKFVSNVTSKKNPIYINYYGDDWYAELTCEFNYKGASIIIPVFMKIELTQNKGSKWMIVAVGSSALRTKIVVTEMAESKVKTNIISPTSNGTNFVSLKRAFDDTENLSNYFDSACLKRSNMLEFYNAILRRKIDFQNVAKIKYHFLLSEGWIFTVEDFIREELNSGWLINHLQKVSSLEVENHRNKLLNGN